MALRTAAQYRESLRDGRVVFYRGQRVPDVTAHPVIRVAIEHASIDYEMAERPETRELAVVKSPETGEPISRYFQVPRTAEDLLKRSALIEAATREGGPEPGAGRRPTPTTTSGSWRSARTGSSSGARRPTPPSPPTPTRSSSCRPGP